MLQKCPEKGQKAAWQILHAKPEGLCLQMGVRLNHGVGKQKLDNKSHVEQQFRLSCGSEECALQFL